MTTASNMPPSANSSEVFKNTDASSYDAVTAEFDRFTTLLTTPLASQLVDLAGLAAGQQVLDIGAGTGVVDFQAAQRVGAEGRVVGIDLSDGMLAVAVARAAAAGGGKRVEFRKMDAEALAFKAESFDAVLSLFALLHFPDPVVALGEMFRVLRPGGKLVVAVGSGPPWFSFFGLFHRLRRVPDLLLASHGKRLFAPDFLNALVERMIPANGKAEETTLARTHHNRAHSLPALIRKAGFGRLRSYWQGQQTIVASPEEFWDLQRTFSSIGRKRLLEAAPEKAALVRSEFLKTCREVQLRGGKLVYPIGAFYVVAERPRDG